MNWPVRSRARLDADAVVDRPLKALFAAQVPLRCLYRYVPEQELNLLQLAAGSVAQTCARAAEVMGCDPAQPKFG